MAKSRLCKCGCGQETPMGAGRQRRWYVPGHYHFPLKGKHRLEHRKADIPHWKMFTQLRYRARKAGIPFDITLDDIVIPERCPVLDVPLSFDGPMAYHPSIDKIIPSLGYVKGNIAVISFRANAIKHNATADEIQKVADWLRSVTKVTV